jgi:hypothetical protein
VPSQQLQGQLQTQYSVDTGSHITDEQELKDSSHNVSFSNSSKQRSLILIYLKKKIVRIIRIKETLPINGKAAMKSPIKVMKGMAIN